MDASSPSRDLPILACADAAAWEARVLGGDPARERDAILRASAGVAAGIRADFGEVGPWPGSPRLLVLAGKGHNGADALGAAEVLARGSTGVAVTVVAAEPLAAWKPLARERLVALDAALGGAVTLRVAGTTGVDPALPRHGWTVVLDGLLGQAASGPPRGGVAAVLAWADGVDAAFRAAVDLPSGLAGGGATFRADATYATGFAKDAVVARSAVSRVGRLRVVDLGFPLPPSAEGPPRMVLGDPCLAPWRRPRPAGIDKRGAGHVLVVGGSRRYPGSVQLAARAATRGGAGRVTVALPESLVASASAALPEAVWVAWPETPDGGLALEGWHLLVPLLGRVDALVVGPGLGEEPETQALVARLLAETSIPAVLDADALRPGALAAAVAARPRGGLVLTPHDGEAARLGIPVDPAWSLGDEATCLAAWAAERAAVLVRKGPATRVVGPGGEAGVWGIAVVAEGGPALARAGSGDVLAGLAGAMLATLAAAGGDASPAVLAARAARAAVLVHARAGDLLARDHGALGFAAGDLVTRFAAALR